MAPFWFRLHLVSDGRRTDTLLASTDDYTLTLMRLTLGIVFFSAWSTKAARLVWRLWILRHDGRFHLDHAHSCAAGFLAIAAEFFGSLGLILGAFTRIAALGIAVNMLVAIFMVHLQFGFFANWLGTQKGEGIEFHLLALALAISIVVRGAGALSVDRALAGKGSEQEQAKAWASRSSTA
jgi:putative oxidoreductase